MFEPIPSTNGNSGIFGEHKVESSSPSSSVSCDPTSQSSSSNKQDSHCPPANILAEEYEADSVSPPVSPSSILSRQTSQEDVNEESSGSAHDDENEESEHEQEEANVSSIPTSSGVSVSANTRSSNNTTTSKATTNATGITKKVEGSIPAVDRSSSSAPTNQVSILGGKYLLVTQTNSTQTSSPSKNMQKCIHIETRQQYVCKVIPRNYSSLQLLSAYQRLDNYKDVINPIHEIIMGPKTFYIVYPINYGNVHAFLLAKKRLREEETANIFKQMVRAVQVCHSHNVILRDLKLGKFVFTNKERTEIKLESLEDAVVLEDGEDDGLSDKHGCPNYVSPEKAEILRNNSKYPGKATDIWGLGVMLYTMLMGRYPFNDPDHGKLFAKIRRCLFVIPEGLSSNVKCLIRCLLRKESDARLSPEEILRHPWIVNQIRERIPTHFIGNFQNLRKNLDQNVSNAAPTETPPIITDDFIQFYPSRYEELLESRKRKQIEETDEEDDHVVPQWPPINKKSKRDNN